jgi:regulatory protein
MRKLNPDQETGPEPAADQPTHSELLVYAGRLLARREFGVGELKSRLLRKWAGADQLEARVAELIADLQADGALSDHRFAESFTRSRCGRCHGPVKIRMELRQRAVPDDIIEEALLSREEEWVGLAATWLAQHCTNPLDYAAKGKYYRRLVNRGFSHQQAMAALTLHASSG